MCGIAGEVSFRERPGDVEKMLDAIVHRGPDDSGLYTDDCTQLGFRRLAIVDLSAAGHQPMTNESETLWLVFNGEVYNYRALTAELQALGHQFRSQTDSEVVLHAYEQWGIACVRRFNGMFAFALWDTQRRRLFAARDRFGVKPFYVARTPQGGLLFASEIKALFRHPRAPRPAPHDDRLFDFLVDGRLDHTNTTCFAGVDQLPAAHTMTVTEGHIDFQRYWDLPDGPPQPWRTPDERALRRLTDEFAHLLEDSIRLRLHADVPVGSCLSGGLDSSAIVSMANRLLFSDETDVPWHARGDRQKTFSACYDDLRHDERAYIEQVVAATGADAHYTFPGESDIAQAVIPRVVWHQDEPFGSTSIVAQWHVMAAAHQRGIKVMLDGQGADELLGGYHGFFGPALVDELLSGNPAQFLRNALLYRRNHHPSFNHVARSMAFGLLPPGSPIRAAAVSAFGAEYKSRAWLTSEFNAAHTRSEPWTANRGTRLQTALYNQAVCTSLPALLHWEDRNSMAFSIEARTPFLDYRLAEFAAGLPNAARMRNGTTKVILRDAMRGILPEPVRYRRDKKGFSTPEDTWFRTTLAGWAREIICSRSLAERGYCSPGALSHLLDEHISGSANHSAVLWRAINVELWARTFIDGDEPRCIS